MDDLGKRIKNVTHELKEYVEKKVELTILNISEEITYWVGKSIQSLIGYTILNVGLFLALIALSIFVGDLVGQDWAGFAIVAAPIILFGLYLVVVKPKSMLTKIQNQIVEELLTSLNKKEKEEKALLAEKTSNKETENDV